jgi:hypothetical protein
MPSLSVSLPRRRLPLSLPRRRSRASSAAAGRGRHPLLASAPRLARRRSRASPLPPATATLLLARVPATNAPHPQRSAATASATACPCPCSRDHRSTAVTEPPKSLGPPTVVLVQWTSDNPTGAPESLDKFDICFSYLSQERFTHHADITNHRRCGSAEAVTIT